MMCAMVQAPEVAAPDGGFRFIGRRTKRADAPERLTGRLRFTNDLLLPGALHVRFVRSPHAAARIVSIDASAARAMPGVVAVLTARDLPVPNIDAAVDARRILLALDSVLFAGQPVAAVLAESEAEAEDGVQAVEVDYEPSAAAVDVLDAMASTRPSFANSASWTSRSSPSTARPPAVRPSTSPPVPMSPTG